jgi:hypothetical protein
MLRDDNFVEGLKNQISTFCICADGFKIFLRLNCQVKAPACFLQNHRRLPECRNKHFEEGYWKDFHNC